MFLAEGSEMEFINPNRLCVNVSLNCCDNLASNVKFNVGGYRLTFGQAYSTFADYYRHRPWYY
jgi:hypothetical protein